MGKKTIWVISSVMLGALLALLGVQWYWTNHTVEMQEQQFRQKVQNALDEVVEGLQDSEIFIALHSNGLDSGATQVVVHKEERVENGHVNHVNETRVIRYIGQAVSLDTTVMEETTVDIQDDGTRKVWALRGDSHPGMPRLGDSGKHYALELVERILQNPLPIAERLDSANLHEKLSVALANRGIHEPIDVQVVRAPYPHDPSTYFVAQLFPHDLPLFKDMLLLRLPGRSGLTLQFPSPLPLKHEKEPHPPGRGRHQPWQPPARIPRGEGI